MLWFFKKGYEMSKIKIVKQMFSLAILSLLFSACSTKQVDISEPKYTLTETQSKEGLFSLREGRNISLEQLTKDVEKYPVIFVGDHHNTEKTHEFFNTFLESLVKKGYKIHLANEWFSPEHNKLLKLYTDGKISSKELKKRRGWKSRWDLIGKIYDTVKKSNGKLYGVNISKKDRKKISQKLFDQMSKEERNFYDNLDLNVTAHKNLVMPFFGHCKHMPKRGNEPCEERMYRVQVAWDTYMAEESAKLAKKVIKTNKDKLIVFAGAMHMQYGMGIPLRFSRVNNLPFYIISNHLNNEKDIYQYKANTVFIYNKEKK